jgi:hypothetical protein
VVDFRKLNDVTVGDSFPIPMILEILDTPSNSKYFSTMYCARGFLQIPVKLEDRPKRAFSAAYEHYEYKRMPVGLKGASSTFQRRMSTVLSGLQGLTCLVYLDDIVLFGENLKVHNERLRNVFARLKSYNLKLQPDKCEFLRKSFVFGTSFDMQWFVTT